MIVPSTATRFVFQVYVSAAVRFPDGWVEITGPAALQPPATQALTATVRTVVGTPVPGAVVTWGTSDAATATMDPVSGQLAAVRAGAVTVTATSGTRSGTLAVQVTGVTRSWSGGAGTPDWGTLGNWALGVVPAAVDSVLVPGGLAVYPALAQATAIGGVLVQDAASLGVGPFDLVADADVRTLGTGIITGTTGRVVLAGSAGTVAGSLPRVLVTGRYALSGDVLSTAPLEVDSGAVDDAAFQLLIDP